MAFVTVVAVRDFLYHGYKVHRGEAIEISPVEAAAHAFAHNVTLDRHAKPTYHTREMVAAEQQTAAVFVEPVPDLPKRRRRSRKAKA